MSSINYYYLDGIEKKGPYTKEEMICKNLTPETLIYFDGLTNWTPLSQFEILKQQTITVEEETGNTNIIDQSNIHQTQETKVRNIKIPSIIFLLLALSISTFLSYLYANSKREKDFKKIESKINAIFKDKDEVCDYNKSGLKGELQDVKIYSILMYTNIPNDNEGNQLAEFYKCESGGWTVLSLKRLNNGFEYSEYTSTNMGFKAQESKQTTGKDLGNGLRTESFSFPTYRGTVQSAYDEAMDHISIGKTNKSYVAGIYEKILTFNEISTDFYKISNIYPTKLSIESVNSDSWKSLGEESIFNKFWIVWFNRYGKHYEIVELKNAFYILWLKYSLVSGFAFAVLFFLIKYRNKIAIEVT